LAILAQWPRFRSERDFWRFASAHLRSYFPNLCTQSQFNRRVRALELELRALQRAFAGEIAEPSALYRVLDTTLVPAGVRVRASRKGLFCGPANFGELRKAEVQLRRIPLPRTRVNSVLLHETNPRLDT
jgi:hypothetical protein